MGNWPYDGGIFAGGPKNNGAGKPAPSSRERLNLSVGFVLDVLAGSLNVFPKTVGRVAPGENNLPHNCDQQAKGGSFQCFHFIFLLVASSGVYNRPNNARMMMITSRSPTIPPGP